MWFCAAILGWIGFAPAVSLFGYAPPPRPALGLRFVTWNIGVAGEVAGAARQQELDRVRETLAYLDADVVVLQEVSRSELSELASAFDGARTAYAAGGGASSGLLVQRGELAQLGSYRSQRGVGRRPVRARVRVEDGREIHVLGVHADPWAAPARNLEIGSAVDLLFEERDVALRVLAGDLNLDVDLGGGKDLFTEDEYLDVQTYNYVAERMQDAVAGGGPTAEPDRRLDYVFTQGLEVLSAGVWRGQRVGGMDHHPVVVDCR